MTFLSKSELVFFLFPQLRLLGRQIMKCPTCSTTLVMADRQGIEIDYCPDCRGVWLDRGELDKIIERASNDSSPTSGIAAPRPMRRDDSDEIERIKSMKYPKKKKMTGVLGDIFDF
jgi:Zn-finger nucleic acid-binding protein